MDNYANPAAAQPPPIAANHVQDALKLGGIIALTVVGVFVLFLQHVLGSLRRRSSDKLLNAMVLASYTLSYALVSYTLGLMQTSDYYLVEFPVWAVCLLMLLGGTDSLTACNLNDVDNWKGFYVRHLLNGVLVVYIVAVYGRRTIDGWYPGYQGPLWAILAFNVVQSYARITSMRMASKSHLLWKVVKPIDDHMKGQVRQPSSSAEERNPKTMKGYRFIVAGERPRLQEKKAKKTDGVSHDVGGAQDKTITTVEDVWGCNGRLLRPDSERGMRLKDVCLSMALSKMLNRRFAGFDLPKAELDITSKFVFQGLLAGDKPAERAFRVIEAELGFVHDLYYTRYPYLYHKGRYFALYLPVVMVILYSWLTSMVFISLKQYSHGQKLSPKTTLYLMAVVIFLEVFQLYLHISSGWLKVALIRSYVARHAQQRRSRIFSAIAGVLLRFKAFRPWEAKLGQYSLLRDFNCTRRTSTFVHYVTLCLVDKARKGRKRGKLVKLSDQVKQAVVDSLVRTKGNNLTNGVTSLQGNGVHQLLWACDAKDGMVTRSILIWHIATSICKHRHNAAVAKGDAQALALSNEDKNAIETASALSQYCAYLVAFAPDLLPDGSFASFTLCKSIKEARDLPLLKDSKTMDRKCDELMKGINATAAGNNDDTTLIELGGRLARQMTDDIKERRLLWKVLSDFWAEMVLYVAPCDDAQAREHLVALARGGEFITHLWALLTHAGVLEQGPPWTQPSV